MKLETTRYDHVGTIHQKSEDDDDDYYDEEDEDELDERFQTTPGPNLEQKVPSRPPNLDATESLIPSVRILIVLWNIYGMKIYITELTKQL